MSQKLHRKKMDRQKVNLPWTPANSGAFIVHVTIYAQGGFRPSTLINLLGKWEDSMNDWDDIYGQEWARYQGKYLQWTSIYIAALIGSLI